MLAFARATASNRAPRSLGNKRGRTRVVGVDDLTLVRMIAAQFNLGFL